MDGVDRRSQPTNLILFLCICVYIEGVCVYIDTLVNALGIRVHMYCIYIDTERWAKLTFNFKHRFEHDVSLLWRTEGQSESDRAEQLSQFSHDENKCKVMSQSSTKTCISSGDMWCNLWSQKKFTMPHHVCLAFTN